MTKKPYDRFLDAIGNENTRKEYESCLRLFMEQYHVTDYDELLKLPTEQAEDMIIEYIKSMKKRGLSEGLTTQRCAAIRKFFSSNRINLNWDFINQHKGQFKKKQKLEAYTREQIEKLLEICDHRTRAITLIFSSTGIRVGALPDLKLRHLKRIGDIYQFTIYENENGEEYMTFCTPECASSIDNYLDYRKRAGEVITEDSYLIIKEFDPDLPHFKHEGVSDSTIRNIITNKMVKSGLRIIEHELLSKGTHRKKIPIHHGFRMFFSSQLVKAKLQPELRWSLEGHSLKNNDNSYVRVKDQLYDEYQKAIPLLTIDQTNNLQDTIIEQKKQLNEVELLKLEHRQQMNMIMNELTEFRERDRLRAEQMKNDEVENQNLIKQIRGRLAKLESD